jgi:hypothetical protein
VTPVQSISETDIMPASHANTSYANILCQLMPTVCREACAMKEYLGVPFERRNDGAFLLCQCQYLLKVLQRFGMEGCKRCATPCMPKRTINEESTDMSNTTFPYRGRSAVCSIFQITRVPSSHSQLECWAAPWMHQVLRMLSLASE